jgi:hypothetical protein
LDSAPSARCVRESDGYHAHVYRVVTHPASESPRPAVIEHHLHTWMAEHRETHPNAKDVSAHRRLGLDLEPLGQFDTLDEAWAALNAVGSVPAVTCNPEP